MRELVARWSIEQLIEQQQQQQQQQQQRYTNQDRESDSLEPAPVTREMDGSAHGDSTIHPWSVIEWNCSSATWNGAQVVAIVREVPKQAENGEHNDGTSDGTDASNSSMPVEKQREPAPLVRIGRQLFALNARVALECVAFRELCTTYRFVPTQLATPVVLDADLIGDAELLEMLRTLEPRTREILELNGFRVEVRHEQPHEPTVVLTGLCTSVEGLAVEDMLEVLEATRNLSLFEHGWSMEGVAPDPSGISVLPLPRPTTLMAWLANRASELAAERLPSHLSRARAQDIVEQFVALERRFEWQARDEAHGASCAALRVIMCPHGKPVLIRLRELPVPVEDGWQCMSAR